MLKRKFIEKDTSSRLDHSILSCKNKQAKTYFIMISDLGAPLSPKKSRGTRTGLSSSFANPPQSPVRNHHQTQNNGSSSSSSSLYINTTSPCSGTKTPPRTADRFIPNRADMDYDFCNHQLNQASKVDENGASLSPTNSTHATRSLQMMLSSVLGGASHRDNNATKSSLDNDNSNSNNNTTSSSSLIHYNSPKRKVARLVGCFHNNKESKRPLRMIGEEALLLRPANWNNGSALCTLTGGGSGMGSSSHSPLSHTSSHHHRAIVSAPTKVLDAPDLMDDYYLNLLRCRHNSTSISIATNYHNLQQIF